MTRTTDLVLLFALALVLGACGGGVIKPSAFDRANGHLDEGRPLEAVQEYRVALNENPGDYRLHYNIGNAYHDAFLAARERDEKGAAEDYRVEAEAHYRKVYEELDPGNARAATGLATLARDSGDAEKAVAILEKALEEKPAEAFVPLWTLGVIRRDAGDRAGAIAAFEEAQERNPEHLPSAIALADLLADSEHPADAEKLLTLFERASAAHPYDFTLRREEALLRVEMASRGNDDAAWREARAALLRAQALSDNDWRIADGLATVREREGEYREAVHQLWLAQKGVAAERNAQRDADRRKHLDDRFRAMQGRLLRLYDLLRRDESQSMSVETR